MNTHEDYMVALQDALDKHPEVNFKSVQIIEQAYLLYYNKYERRDFNDICRITDIDIINNFEEYRLKCQDELWNMLKRESKYLVEEVATRHRVLTKYGYESVEKCLLDIDAVKDFRNFHESMMKQAKTIRDYYIPTEY